MLPPAFRVEYNQIHGCPISVSLGRIPTLAHPTWEQGGTWLGNTTDTSSIYKGASSVSPSVVYTTLSLAQLNIALGGTGFVEIADPFGLYHEQTNWLTYLASLAIPGITTIEDVMDAWVNMEGSSWDDRLTAAAYNVWARARWGLGEPNWSDPLLRPLTSSGTGTGTGTGSGTGSGTGTGSGSGTGTGTGTGTNTYPANFVVLHVEPADFSLGSCSVGLSPMFFEWAGPMLGLNEPMETGSSTDFFRTRHVDSIQAAFTDVSFEGNNQIARYQGLIYVGEEDTPSNAIFPVGLNNQQVQSVEDGPSKYVAAFGSESRSSQAMGGAQGTSLYPGIRIFIPQLDFRLMAAKTTGQLRDDDALRTRQ